MPLKSFVSVFQRFRVSAFYIWLGAVTFVSLLPADALPDELPLPVDADKVIHLLMYTILSLLARPALMRDAAGNHQIKVIAIMAGIVIYGALLDTLQPLISTRSFEWADILANTAGVLCGSLLWRYMPKPFLTKPELDV